MALGGIFNVSETVPRNTTFLLYVSSKARCCIQTRGLSRGIKIVMDSHTILLMLVLNMMFLYMYVYVGQFRRCTITDKNCIFRNIAESPTVAPESL